MRPACSGTRAAPSPVCTVASPLILALRPILVHVSVWNRPAPAPRAAQCRFRPVLYRRLGRLFSGGMQPGFLLPCWARPDADQGTVRAPWPRRALLSAHGKCGAGRWSDGAVVFERALRRRLRQATRTQDGRHESATASVYWCKEHARRWRSSNRRAILSAAASTTDHSRRCWRSC